MSKRVREEDVEVEAVKKPPYRHTHGWRETLVRNRDGGVVRECATGRSPCYAFEDEDGEVRD